MEGERAGRDDVLGLPRPVGVAGICQVRRRGGQVHHAGQADAQVRVRVHRQAQAERLADPREQLRPGQAAPVMVVREHDRDGTARHRRCDLVEGHHAHVGGQRHRRLPGDFGHPVQPGRGIFEVLNDAVEFTCHLHRGPHRPGRVRVDAQRVVRERGPQRPDRLDLLLWSEHAALELDRGEPVVVDHARGLPDDAIRVESLAPGVGGTIWMGRPLVEQVGAERHGVPDRAAEQVADRPAEDLALHVQAGHLERREHPVDRAGRRDHPGQPVPVGASIAAEHVRDRAVHLVEREDVQAGQGARRRPQPAQVPLVGIGLAEAC